MLFFYEKFQDVGKNHFRQKIKKIEKKLRIHDSKKIKSEWR